MRLQGCEWCSAAVPRLPLAEVRWLVLDVETTGLDPAQHRVTELAAIEVDCAGAAAPAVEWRAGTSRQIELVGILDRLRSQLDEGAVLVAHNLAFDLTFLSTLDAPNELTSPRRWVCSMRMTGAWTALDRLASRLEIEVTARHSALGDTRTLAAVLCELDARARSQGSTTVAGLVAACPIGERNASSPTNLSAGVLLGWNAMLQDLDHVVPAPFVNGDRRAAVARTALELRDPLIGPDTPAEYDSVRAILAEAGVTAVNLEILLDELDLRLPARNRRYLNARTPRLAAADP